MKKVGTLKKSFTLPNHRSSNDVDSGPSGLGDFEFQNTDQWRPKRRRRMSLDMDLDASLAFTPPGITLIMLIYKKDINKVFNSVFNQDFSLMI